jgi:5-methylcytosine-specific restriction protein A
MSDWTRRRDERANDARRRAATPYLAWYRTAAWRLKRKAQLEAEPWCRFHARRGERVAATVADHIERHRGDATRFWHGALQSLCASCHSGLKQSLERGNRAGCDDAGAPVDADHPWFR